MCLEEAEHKVNTSGETKDEADILSDETAQTDCSAGVLIEGGSVEVAKYSSSGSVKVAKYSSSGSIKVAK